jgi:dTDP-glucose pyrophosphorylase
MQLPLSKINKNFENQTKIKRIKLVNMKGLIPAAGMRTRLKPLTPAIPKELLIVGDKAVIEHVIEAFKLAGITDIFIVVGWKKHAILDYFGSGNRLDVDITYIVQDEQNGLSNAVVSGRRLTDGESFAVVLGDNYFYPNTFLCDIIKYHNKKIVIAQSEYQKWKTSHLMES